MKRLIFNNGNIEFFTNDVLLYDERYLKKNKLNVFENYDGGFGLNDCSLAVVGTVNLKGFIQYPAYIRVKGMVDLIVPSNINLSVMSNVQGNVNNAPIPFKNVMYGYGITLWEYAEKYFKELIGTDNFEMMHDLLTYSITIGKKSYSINVLDLCEKSNLIYIDVISDIKHPVNITVEHTLDEIVKADIEKLSMLEKYFVDKEEYENASIIHKRILKIFED